MHTNHVMSDLREMKAYLDALPFDDEPLSAETSARIRAAQAGERGISTEEMRRELERLGGSPSDN